MKNYKETQESDYYKDRIMDTFGRRKDIEIRVEPWRDFRSKWQSSSHLGDLEYSYKGVHLTIIQ